MGMYYNEFIQIIEKILTEKISKKNLEEYLIYSFDSDKIYESDDVLLTDVFFTLKHYASGEEIISKNEWIFLKKCLLGECEYSIDEKMRITTKPPNRQA